MSGTVNISRDIFGDEAFRAEPFTEREAFIWLIMEARWKPGKKRVGEKVISLERGQLAASVRFMAGAWKWTAPKVQRYLKRVSEMDLICSKTDTGVTVITICKYDDYQSKPKASDTDAIQTRYRADTNENKGEIREEGKREEADASLSPSQHELPHLDETAEAVAEYNAAASEQGWPKVQVLSKARRSSLNARLKECGGIQGWRDALAKARASPLCTGQNDRGWVANFDFLITQSKFIKLMEGAYDDRKPANQNREAAKSDALRDTLHDAARMRRTSEPNWL